MKQLILRSLKLVPISFCALSLLLAYNAKAQNAYFDVNGTTAGYGTTEGSTYSWDDPNWATVTGGASPTANWVQGSFARFLGTGNYTNVVNNSETNSGMFQAVAVSSGFTVTINAAGAGNLTIAPNGTLTTGLPVQGFFCNGGNNLVINAPITGLGGINFGLISGTGNIYLYGNNTYSGGSTLTTSSYLINFNNNNSFGTGPININGTTFAALLAQGGSPITLPNSFTNATAVAGINFASAANTPVTCTGPWSLLFNLNLRNNGNSTAPLTLSGPVSGVGGLNLSANNGGKITLSGANTYTGKTSITAGSNLPGIGMTVSADSINSVSGGSPSSNLGAPTAGNGTIAIGVTSFASTLIYTGAGETTDRAIDLAGTTGGVTLQADGAGPVTFSSPFTATGAGSKALTLQGSNTGLNTVGGAIVDNSGANKTSVVKAQAGTWRLSGVNTYSGGTTVTAGTLEIAGSIAGNVTNNSGTLQLDSSTALSSGASAVVALGGALPNGSVILNFSGSQTVNALYIGGVAQATGTWGASGADHNSALFSGTGKLNVLGAPVVITQPQSVVAWPDGSATFTVTALGSPTYQWKRNGVDVGGGNASSLPINPVEAVNAGTYVCWLTNAFGWTNTANAILTVRTTNDYTAIVRADSPISYWRLDEPNGTIAYDSVGPNNGSYNNVILSKTPGYSVTDTDPCVNLQKMPVGQGSFVSVANYQAFNFFTNPSPQFTLEAWAYFTNITGVQRLFSTDAVTAPGGYMFGISGANQLVFTTSAYQDYYMPPTGSLPSPLQANVWYHLVVACDGSFLHYYVNGQPVGTALLAASHGGTNGVPMSLGANGNFLSSGGGTIDNSEQVKGYIDECAIYGTFLGDFEILQHYNASLPSAPVAQTPVADQPTNYVSLTTTFTMNAVGQDLHYQWTKVGSGPVGSDSSTLAVGPLSLSDAGSYQCLVSNGGGSTNPPAAVLTVLSIPTTASQVGLTNDLVLHLPFDADYKDISGHSNNGTNVNATTLPTDTPKVGGGYLQYSSTAGGPYNYVTLGKPSDLLFGPSGNFSVAFWVRQTGRYTNLPFFGNATNSTGAHLGFALAPGLANDGSPIGAWAWSFFDGATQDFATGDQDTIADTTWHHLTYVFDRASSATVYLDGRYVSSVNDSYLGGVDSGAVFNIGQDPTGAYSADAQADLDDLGVWKRALTQLEVSGMYLAGANNVPGVSFAPVIIGAPATATTVGSLSAGATTLSYSGGSGSRFVLVGTNNVAAPLANWPRLATNTVTPGSFTIPAVGSGVGPMYYRVKSE